MTVAGARVALIAPMPSELRPLVRRLGLTRAEGPGGAPAHTGTVGEVEVVAIGTGIGPDRAAAATEALLSSTVVSRVVVSGIAGGLAPLTAVGDLLVPAEVVDAATGERFRAAPFGEVALAGVLRTGDGSEYELGDRAIAQLRDEGIAAVDMETAAVARACQARGVPWTAFRAISDMAGDESVGPVVLTLVDGQGRPRLGAAARFLLTHPGRIPRMVRLGRDADRAARLAADAASRALRRGS